VQVRQDGELSLSIIASVGLAVTLAAIAVLLPIQSTPTAVATVTTPPLATAAQVFIPTYPTPIPATPTPLPTSNAFAMSISDAELTQAAAGGFPQTVSGVTVSDPVVSVLGASVRLVAKAKVFFGSTQFVMNATPVVSDGRIAVRVDSATLAGLSLPDDTKASIATTVQGTISRMVPANVRVTGFLFAPGSLTVQGTRN
jgi:hypothetical protein